MDLSNYKFPEVTELDLPFPTFNTTEELVEEAKKRNPQKGMKKFSEIFYSGGNVMLKKDVDGTWKENACKYAFALMGSFSPKHENKLLVVGMIFEECLIL